MIKLIFTISLILLVSGIQAQVSNPASGGEASGNGGTSSYTIGQVAYSIHSGMNGSVAEGIHQPYEISTLTGAKEEWINLGISAYPNPVSDMLILEVDLTDHSINTMEYQLYNVSGMLLENKKLNGDRTFIEMTSYHSSSFILRVLQNKQEVKTFKIIKY